MGDHTALETFRADCATIFNSKPVALNGGTGNAYSSGTTFWVSADADVANLTVLEAVALKTMQFHAGNAGYDPARSGAEFWTMVLERANDEEDEDDDVAFHWDRDYDAEETTNLQIHPHISTVTYLTDGGAPTVVLECPAPVEASEHPALMPEGVSVHASWPVVGRHLSFDGRFLHGAPAKFAHGTPKKCSHRVTFLVNVWLNHKPADSTPLPMDLRKKLCLVQDAQLAGIAVAELELSRLPQRQISARVLSDAVPMHEFPFREARSRRVLRLPWPADEAAVENFATFCFSTACAPQILAAPPLTNTKKKHVKKTRCRLAG